MTETLRICIELAVFSLITLNVSIKFNNPYPYNSTFLDYIEGLSCIVFVPTVLFSIGRGIWLL